MAEFSCRGWLDAFVEIFVHDKPWSNGKTSMAFFRNFHLHRVLLDTHRYTRAVQPTAVANINAYTYIYERCCRHVTFLKRNALAFARSRTPRSASEAMIYILLYLLLYILCWSSWRKKYATKRRETTRSLIQRSLLKPTPLTCINKM